MNSDKVFRKLIFQRFQSIKNDVFLIFGFDVDVIFDAFDIENIIKIDSMLLSGRFYKKVRIFGIFVWESFLRF